MSEYKNVVITKTARMKLVKARAGAAALPRVIGMAFGSGGVNADGTVKTPSGSQTALADERYRKAVDKYSFPDETTCRYECTLLADELANEERRNTK
jgi:phage-related tail fiber protein